MDEEALLIDAFVVAAKRGRLKELLAKPKRRADATASLAHFGDLDPRWVVALPGASQNAASVERELRMRGADDSCHVVSEDTEIDGKRLPLKSVLEYAIGRGMGTLVSCLPGRLAFFEGEGPSDRCILARPANSPRGR